MRKPVVGLRASAQREPHPTRPDDSEMMCRERKAPDYRVQCNAYLKHMEASEPSVSPVSVCEESFSSSVPNLTDPLSHSDEVDCLIEGQPSRQMRQTLRRRFIGVEGSEPQLRIRSIQSR